MGNLVMASTHLSLHFHGVLDIDALDARTSEHRAGKAIFVAPATKIARASVMWRPQLKRDSCRGRNKNLSCVRALKKIETARFSNRPPASCSRKITQTLHLFAPNLFVKILPDPDMEVISIPVRSGCLRLPANESFKALACDKLAPPGIRVESNKLARFDGIPRRFRNDRRSFQISTCLLWSFLNLWGDPAFP
jgi:hypothetical protein